VVSLRDVAYLLIAFGCLAVAFLLTEALDRT
jgi:hypothetical protein